jgi:predicted secreted protein
MRGFYAYLILVSVTCLILPSAAIQIVEEWNRTFGGPYGDGIWSLDRIEDGGFIMAGFTSSNGQGSDLWLLKVNDSGIEIWDRIFGGSGEDIGYSVQETSDKGFIVAGTTKSYGIGGERLWLLRTDANGNRLWDRTFGGFVSSSGDGAWSVVEADDGGFVTTGYTSSFGAGGTDLWLIKTDSWGNQLWDRSYGGPKDEVGMSLVQTRDEGYMVAGRTESYGSGEDDIWLLKVDSEGSEQWNRTFGGEKDDVGLQVLEAGDGYVIVGRTESFGSKKKAFLLKIDSEGREIWEKTYGEESSGISVQTTTDGGFIIAGRSEMGVSGRDALLIKTDSSGNKQWMMPLGGLGDDIGTYIVQSPDDGYVMSGITNSYRSGAEDAWIVKLAALVESSMRHLRNTTELMFPKINSTISLPPGVGIDKFEY